MRRRRTRKSSRCAEADTWFAAPHGVGRAAPRGAPIRGDDFSAPPTMTSWLPDSDFLFVGSFFFNCCNAKLPRFYWVLFFYRVFFIPPILLTDPLDVDGPAMMTSRTSLKHPSLSLVSSIELMVLSSCSLIYGLLKREYIFYRVFFDDVTEFCASGWCCSSSPVRSVYWWKRVEWAANR